MLKYLLFFTDEYKVEPSQRSDEWFTEAVHRATPHFNVVHERMKRLPPEIFENLLDCCSWMKQFDTIQLCFHLWKENEELTSHEGLALITPALERAIGNVRFYTQKKTELLYIVQHIIDINFLVPLFLASFPYG